MKKRRQSRKTACFRDRNEYQTPTKSPNFLEVPKNQYEPSFTTVTELLANGNSDSLDSVTLDFQEIQSKEERTSLRTLENSGILKMLNTLSQIVSFLMEAGVDINPNTNFSTYLSTDLAKGIIELTDLLSALQSKISTLSSSPPSFSRSPSPSPIRNLTSFKPLITPNKPNLKHTAYEPVYDEANRDKCIKNAQKRISQKMLKKRQDYITEQISKGNETFLQEKEQFTYEKTSQRIKHAKVRYENTPKCREYIKDPELITQDDKMDILVNKVKKKQDITHIG